MSKKFSDIKTKLTALQTAAKALDTRSEAMVNKATSSDDKVFSVTSAGGSVNLTSHAPTYLSPTGATAQAVERRAPGAVK